MRLKRLTLKNVGVFDDASFEFPAGSDPTKADTYLFVGPNGSGKTTALLALAQFFSEYPTGINLRTKPESEIRLERDDKAWGLLQSQSSASSPGRFTHLGGLFLEVSTDGRFLDWMAAPAGVLPRRAYGYSGARSIEGSNIAGIVEMSDDPRQGTVAFQSSSAPFVQWVANTFAKVAFAQQRGEPELARVRLAALESVTTFIRGVTSHSFELVLRDEPLAVRCRLEGKELSLNVLPDGLRSILSWLGDLLMRIDRTTWPADGIAPLDRKHLLFLDEVEVHLHPKWQRRVLPALQSLLPNAQIFATTHSPFVLASATDAFIYKLDAGRVTGPLSTEKDGIDGQSVQTILREILEVDGEFSDAVEAELRALEEDCRKAITGDDSARERARQRASQLSLKGPELTAIAQRQLKLMERQLARSPAA